MGIALLTSCNGDSRLAPQEDLSPANTSVTPAVSPVANSSPERAIQQIGEIVWAAVSDPTTNAPTEIATTYPPEALRITASLPVDDLPAGARVEATWRYNDTSLDDFTRQIVTSAPTDQAWISFYIDRDPATPWPAGIYEVNVSLNGNVIQRASVDVTPQD
jgi:hypothetical protein